MTTHVCFIIVSQISHHNWNWNHKIATWFWRMPFSTKGCFEMDPRWSLNKDPESLTAFQDAFDPFFLFFSRRLSLGNFEAPPAGAIHLSAALRALGFLSVGRQNGAWRKEKGPLFEFDKGGEDALFSPLLLPPPIKHSGAYLQRLSREVVE